MADLEEPLMIRGRASEVRLARR